MAPKKPPKVTTPETSDDESDRILGYEIGNLIAQYAQSGISLFIRELGLRILYHKSVSDHYHLYNKEIRYVDYENAEEVLDIGGAFTADHQENFVHKWLSFIRFHHRSDKRMHRDEGMQFTKHHVTINFPGRHSVGEDVNMGNEGRVRNFPDSRKQEVKYGNGDYKKYEDINSDINKFNLERPGIISRLKENFKRILHGYEALGEEKEVEFTYALFCHLFGVEADRDPGSFIMIPMALELWQNHPELGLVGNDGGLIPVCFTDAMQALAYMRDKLETSLRYGYDYEKQRAGSEKNYREFSNRVESTLKMWLGLSEDEPLPDANTLLDHLYCLCGRWYGFTPDIQGYEVHHTEIDRYLLGQGFQKLFPLKEDNGSEQGRKHGIEIPGFRDAGGGGYCFYHSVVDQLANIGIHMDVADVQTQAINHILDHPMYYSDFIAGLNEVQGVQTMAAHGNYQGALEAYIQHHIGHTGVWADDLIIHATSNALNMTIQVHMFDQHGHYIQGVGGNVIIDHDPLPTPTAPVPVATLVIGNIANAHFVSQGGAHAAANVDDVAAELEGLSLAVKNDEGEQKGNFTQAPEEHEQGHGVTVMANILPQSDFHM